VNRQIAFACLAAAGFAGQAISQHLTSGTRPEIPLTGFAREVDAAVWNAPLAPGSSGAAVVRAQILLDRARFSPGEIDGSYGDDLAVAVRGYREAHGLSPSGAIDSEMWKLLSADTRPVIVLHTITAGDVKGPFTAIPKDVRQQARMKWMGYESPQEELGERFHAAPKLLAELNPGQTLDQAGERIAVPAVRRGPVQPAIRIVISKSKRRVEVAGAGGRLLAEYPATIGGPHDPLPIGSWKVTGVVHDPWFNWDPVHFWNVDPGKAAERLPPGPNNPAGVVWIGLSLEHYGIHGTPDPGHIRHDQSYGCIRLTNWDAEDLSHMVRRGTPVLMVE